ncbi:hypothetical protein HYC85_030497 [Camellia sinensis]|uniref:Uncharacterized protein n=1 Tax=Camellia sinensis TaxID=4442 RepID=A0A7J7G4Y5_CAMSI|nr:hypothetical protein HYC85_030497 [Camellia sinensis]
MKVRGINIASLQSSMTLDSKATILTDLNKILTQGLHESTIKKEKEKKNR